MAGLDGLIQGVCILRRHKHAQNGILALSGPTCQGRRSLCQWLLACFAFQGIRRPQSQPKPFNANLCVRLSWIVVCFCVLLIALPGCESWRRFGSDRSSFMGESCQTNKFGCKFQNDSVVCLFMQTSRPLFEEGPLKTRFVAQTQSSPRLSTVFELSVVLCVFFINVCVFFFTYSFFGPLDLTFLVGQLVRQLLTYLLTYSLFLVLLTIFVIHTQLIEEQWSFLSSQRLSRGRQTDRDAFFVHLTLHGLFLCISLSLSFGPSVVLIFLRAIVMLNSMHHQSCEFCAFHVHMIHAELGGQRQLFQKPSKEAKVVLL